MNTLSIQFHKLSFEKKKEKLITLLDQLKPSDDIFRQTMVCIKCTEVDEKFLDDTYKAIIEF
ncbi:MAG: hypothetical protein LBU27_05890 [Candidatus Peribacteria bacterium]|nr:hypothetical protein [Candidatus Peribacteria bacterium]